MQRGAVQGAACVQTGAFQSTASIQRGAVQGAACVETGAFQSRATIERGAASATLDAVGIEQGKGELPKTNFRI